MAEPNPFEVTKAVDFTDEEIASTFVDLPGGGFLSLADPAGPMPRFLVGGKGGGRTHLLRYSSFQLQRLRHRDVLSGLREDGYLGIYFRCGGLNAGRFSGKRQSSEAWAGSFAYYMDVWLAQLTIQTLLEIGTGQDDWTPAARDSFVQGVLTLFDDPPALGTEGDPLVALTETLNGLRREMDRSINNAALRQSLDVNVRSVPGRLIFGVARLATQIFRGLQDVHFVYLLDEFENFDREQQRYVNTLIREKELPTNFVVGSRLWGLRTMETLSAGEENRQGSEYDRVILEEAYREDPKSYRTFCRNMVRSRIREAGHDSLSDRELSDLFDSPSMDEGMGSEAVKKLLEGYPPNERPYFKRLRSRLDAAGFPDSLADELIETLMVPSHPLLEKLSLLQLYRVWATRPESLRVGAVEAAVRTRSLLTERPMSSVAQLLKHWRADLVAQIYDECASPQLYLGLNRFIEMSGFLPRNLLIILKQVTRWSIFLGEAPFEGARGISEDAQVRGVKEASGWFLIDSKALGDAGEDTQVAIRRLGSFLRQLRFSDKPVEVSCASFSTDRQSLTPRALTTLDTCVEHSILLEIPHGQRHRNSRILHHKYQMNPMLAPNFDLPTARRGVTPLSATEMLAIFDVSTIDQEVDSVLSRRLSRMNAPFGRSGSSQGFLL